MSSPVRIFIRHAQKDQEHRTALETPLAELGRQPDIELWTDHTHLATPERSSELLAIRPHSRLRHKNPQAQDILDGRFRLLHPIGRGSFASSWLAQRLDDQKIVVVKCLHSSLTDDPERLLLVREGFEKLAQLAHPHILKVLEPCRLSTDADTGHEPVCRHFVVLEWAGQGDLAVWSRKRKYAPTVQEVLRTGIDAASALAFAHARGCIHRNVKPRNLLQMADGTLKLADFDPAGLINPTLPARKGATGLYIAPELLAPLDEDNGTAITGSVDVYSLGWTLVALLQRRDITAASRRDPSGLLTKLKLPDSVQSLLLKAIEPDPTDRYQTMLEFREALVQVRAKLYETHPAGTLNIALAGPVSLPPEASALTPGQRLEAALARLPLKERLERLHALGQSGDPRLGLEKPENWRWLPPGEFRMGADDVSADEKPVHAVTLTRGFYLSRFPVTNHDFRAFIDAGGYAQKEWWSEAGWEFSQNEAREAPAYWTDDGFNAPNQPVVGVSWYEADAFCRWMNAQRFSWDAPGRFRLPTEAEWEYAARGQEGREYPWGLEEPSPERANYGDIDVNRTSPVGAFWRGASREGLLDLAGNCWEWCGHCYRGYPKTAQVDPTGPAEGWAHPVRGGSWLSSGYALRSAIRERWSPDFRYFDLGFRVARA